MRTLLLAIASVTLLTTPAQAQSRPIQLEGLAGWTGFADESVIHHGDIGLRARIPLASRVWVGPEVLFMKGPDVDRDLFANAVIAFDFRDESRAVVPYAIGTAGFMWHRSQYGFGPNVPGLQTVWNRQAHASGGVGLRGRASDRVRIGAEARVGTELELTVVGTVSYSLR